MIQRLIFSIAIYSSPDILLLDEVFEVGDESFRKKSAEKIKELVKNDKISVLLVSHDLEMVEKYCDKVLLLRKGQIIEEGNPRDVVNLYKQNN